MKEPLVDLEFTQGDRLRLLACVCSGHVFRKRLSYTHNLVAALDIFSEPAWCGLERFGKGKSKGGSLLEKLIYLYLRWKYSLFCVDVQIWWRDVLDKELFNLPSFIEAFPEAEEVAATHSVNVVDGLPASMSLAEVRGTCLRMGLVRRTSQAQFKSAIPVSEDTTDQAYEQGDPIDSSYSQSPPQRTYDPETGAHRVVVSPETMTMMNSLFKRVQEEG